MSWTAKDKYKNAWKDAVIDKPWLKNYRAAKSRCSGKPPRHDGDKCPHDPSKDKFC